MKLIFAKFGCLFLLASSCLSTSWAKVLEDFDQPCGLGDRWTASKGMFLERTAVSGDVRHEGVTGRMLKVKAVGGGYFASKSDFPAPRFDASSAVKFRMKAPGASEEEPLVFEFQAYAKERKAWRWRKVSIDSTGWQTVELPTRYFRHSPAAYLSWEDTRRFAFRFRNAGRVGRICQEPARQGTNGSAWQALGREHGRDEELCPGRALYRMAPGFPQGTPAPRHPGHGEEGIDCSRANRQGTFRGGLPRLEKEWISWLKIR